MRCSPIRLRPVAACLAGAALLVLVAPASAKEGTSKESKRAVCMAAMNNYKAALDREKDRHWMEARELYASCAQAGACPGLATRCQGRADKLAATMPSVVPVVTNEDGSPKVDVQVRFDGKVLCSQLDGTSLPVDAGLHEMTFAGEQGVFATQKVLIVETQRNRLIPVTMGHANGPAPAEPTPVAVAPSEMKPAAKEDEPSRALASTGIGDAAAEADRRVANAGGWRWPRSPWPYVLGGAGLAALAGGGLLTVWGNRDNDLLKSQCRPFCQDSSLDHVRALYTAADVSFGVGAAALAVTTFLFATSRGPENPPPSRPLGLDVKTSPAGAFASVSGAF